MSLIKPLEGRREGQSWFDWLFTNPDTGDKVFGQFPNLPLALFLGCWLGARLISNETVTAVLAIGATLALLWWALWEAIAGDAPWRRLMGLFVAATMLVGLVNRLLG